jgi:heme exporter protein D
MSIREFFEMGGYAVYVWGSYGVAAVIMAAEIMALWRRRRTLLHRLGRITRKSAIGMGNETQA